MPKPDSTTVPDPKSTTPGSSDTPPVLSEEQFSAVVPLKVDGKVVHVPLSELAAGHQKALAADRRFQEAHELSKSASTALDLQKELQEAIKTRNLDTFLRVLRMGGMSEEDIQQHFSIPPTSSSRQARGAPAVESDDEGVEGVEGDEENPLQQVVLALNEKVETLAKIIEKDRATRVDETFQSQLDQVVDKDPVLGRLIADENDEDTRRWIRQVIRSCVDEASKVHPRGVRAIQAGLEKAKKRLKAIGHTTSDTEDGGSAALDSLTGATAGVGPTSAGVSTLHRTSRTAKKTSVLSADFARDLLDRLASMRRGKAHSK